MALKFWLGGVASDKSRRLIEYILNGADKHPQRQYLVIVPEQFGLATQRELVLRSKNHGILNIDVLSFTRFAHRISDEVGSYGSDITMLDEMGKSLIIGMLARQKRSELTVFGDQLDKPGYVDKIKSLICEFMQYGITPEKAFELAKSADNAGRGLLAGKLHDVALLYQAFKEYINNRYTTVEEMLDMVSTLIPGSQTVANSEIIFDGFTGFTPVQNKLIGVLLENALSVHVALLMEDCIQENGGYGRIREHELFYLSKRTMNQLGRMADERHVIIEDPYKADKYDKNNTRNTKSDIVYTEDDDALKLNNTSVQIFCSSNPSQEIRMVFSEIKRLIRESRYHYRDIAILTGDMTGYRHTIEREFGKHDIPFFIDCSEPITLNPFIEYIRSFIDIFSDNYSISSVFRFLKSGLTGFDDEDIYALENYCLAAGIKGAKKWHKRFDTHTQAVGADELERINAVREEFIAKTDRFSKSLDEKGVINAGSKYTIRQFCMALYRLIESDGIEKKLKDAAEVFEETGDKDLASQYGRIYVKIMNTLEQLCDLIPDEITDIRGFGNLLDAGFDNIRVPMIPTGIDYIQVGDLTRSRLGDIKALFIVGANDGVIPKAPAAGGVINENDREFLLRSNADLCLAPTSKDDIYTQQLYIYMAAAKPTQSLYISYSLVSGSGSSLLPSYIIAKIVEKNPHAGKVSPGIERYYPDEEEAFEDLTTLIRPAASGTLPEDCGEKVEGLIRYFARREDYKNRLKCIVEKDILRTDRVPDTIGSALARAIYGDQILAGVTRLENYAKCAYRYFLEYGIGLREREIFSFEARDIGNIFHDCMRIFSQLMEEAGNDWAHSDETMLQKLMDTAVDRAIAGCGHDKFSYGARYAYMEERIRRTMHRSADVICSQIKKGSFSPKYFEAEFSRKESDDISLFGRIDRVDTYEAGEGVYIRVIDYKLSHYEMDPAAVYEGRQLQLLVYLDAAMGMVKKDTAATVIPAGVLYYQIDDPVIEEKTGLSPEDIHSGLMKKLSFSGFVNTDGDIPQLMDADIATDSTVTQLTMTNSGSIRQNKQAVTGDDIKVMAAYAEKCIKSIGRHMLGGNISIPKPDGKTRFTGPDCRNCPYTSICNNTTAIVPEAEKTGFKKEEWIALMRKAVTEDGE